MNTSLVNVSNRSNNNNNNHILLKSTQLTADASSLALSNGTDTDLKANGSQFARSDILETPQIGEFAHENLFAAQFREELHKQSSVTANGDHLFSANFDAPAMATPSSFTSMKPLNLNKSPVNSSVDNSNGSKSAPKKNLLLRTISQTENEMQKQEALKNLILTLNSNEDQQQLNCLDFNNNNMRKPVNSFGESNEIHFTINDVKNERKTGAYITNSFSEPSSMSSTPLNSASSASEIVPFQTSISNDFTLASGPDDTSMMLGNICSAIKSRSNSSSGASMMDDEMCGASDGVSPSKRERKKGATANNEVRRQQIRNSNREAARRCRERRRLYIETLEKNIQNLQSKQKNLLDENVLLKNQISSLQKQLNDSKECSNNVNVLKAATSNIILNGQNAPQFQLIQNSAKQFVAIASQGSVHQQQILQIAETQKHQHQHQQQQQHQHTLNKIVPVYFTLDDPSKLHVTGNESLFQQLMSVMNGSGGSPTSNSGIVGLTPQLLAANNINTISLVDIDATKSPRSTNV